MSYATLAQLIDRHGENVLILLTDRGVTPLGMIDAAVVARALADTDAVIDAHLKARYILPLAEVPPLLVDLAAAIALWKLHRHEPNQKVKDDYSDAMRQLRALSEGALRLPVASGAESIGSGGTGARVTDRERPLTADSLKGYI
ncbi:gp436 family protein [Tabrizicola fusiformis]|uniref:gp436 family protein n=1 Tax=Tabrizicola sp. SY72 TaxID=2741673 RepID=UPI001574409A|nr:DUF1320 domain-containing protein [Tabrizicola sp. SY72]NTT88501.1 DUF1320 domain-containing protein [Tabrizicola sp. SY72]